MRKLKPGDLVRFRARAAHYVSATHLVVYFETPPHNRRVPFGAMATVVKSYGADDTDIDVLIWSEREVARGFHPGSFELVEEHHGHD